jgi:hypothetical protein
VGFQRVTREKNAKCLPPKFFAAPASLWSHFRLHNAAFRRLAARSRARSVRSCSDDHDIAFPVRAGGLRGSVRAAERRRRFQFCIERFQVVGRLFLQLVPLGHFQLCILAVLGRSARSAARPCTRCCGFEVSETIPFPGADSIFSIGCGAISGRLRF